MLAFSSTEFDHHERVQFCHDPDSGLYAIIAIHSTALGPAAGGCRIWPYARESDAVDDALRLSRGMTYKNAMAGLPLGGGKAVIIGDARTDKLPALLQAFGDAVNKFGGDYITAEDVGMSLNDMELIATRTPFVAGRSKQRNKAGGDPSPVTAYGVYQGITAALMTTGHISDPEDLSGIRVAVQGVGSVGYHLCKRLQTAGATVLVSDINTQRLNNACYLLGAQPVAPEGVLFEDVDVLAPCALGAVINSDTVPRIRAAIVAGAANNQLADIKAGDALAERGILYAPDYVINAGGIINVAYEYLDLGDETAAKQKTEEIGPRFQKIFLESRKTRIPTHRIADSMAREHIASAQKN